MKYIIGSFLLIAYLSGFSQKVIKEKIKWKNVLKESIDSEIKYFLNFDYASYNLYFLPVYNYRKELPSQINLVEAKIEDPVYQDFSDEELRNINELDKIADDITVESIVQYERKKPYALISFVPIRKNKLTNRFEKLIQFNLLITEKFVPRKKNKSKQGTYAQNSVLSAGKWVKIKIDRNGIYKLTYSELKNMGISNPENLSVYGNGGVQLPLRNNEFRYDDLIQNSVSFQDINSDGSFNEGDYVLFYGQGPNKWRYDTASLRYTHVKHRFSDYSYYFLTDSRTKKVISAVNSLGTSNISVASFDDFMFHETDSLNLIKSGSLWVGEHFDLVNNYNFNYNFPNLISSAPVVFYTSVLARSSVISKFNIYANGQAFTPLSVNAVNMSTNTAPFAAESLKTYSFYSGSDNISINFSYEKSNSSSEGWLNYFELNVRRNLWMNGSQLIFRDIQSAAPGKIASFNIGNAASGLRVWDVTDPFNIQQINPGSTANNTFIFNVSTDSLREFIAFDGSSFLSPAVVGDVANQNLHGLNGIDLVIVTHPDFKEYADQFADHHRLYDNFSVFVAKPEEVYNEFSSGSPDVAAIRDFMKMLYDKAGANESLMPKYLLLYGDGSYDNKSNLSSNTNFIMTYQSANSLDPTQSYVSDDFFALLDSTEGTVNGIESMDIGVGRFPVKTKEEAKLMLDKVKNYTSANALGDWRNIVTFVGDDAEDVTAHQTQTDDLANKVDTTYNMKVYNIDKIFLDAYQQITTPTGNRYPDVNIAINNRIKKGTLVFNYTGHGNELGLAHERVVTTSDIASWDNWNKLPVFITATCDFSRFDDFDRTSAGELILLNSKGGAIALFSTTRLVYSSPNFSFNLSFYDFIFKCDQNNNVYRLGEVMRRTKNARSDNNKRNFVLLGDPALQIAVPKYNVATVSINNRLITTGTDTIKALSKVTITGEVNDHSGNKLGNFNGILYPTVYDKYLYTETRGNDGNPPLHYRVQNKILFKGKASVKSGEFTFSFIVPKDISYSIGYGKISYYSDNSITDAAGYYKGIVIGGSSDIALTDNQGPVIKLYMNDSTFVFGGITDENPKMLAKLNDFSGINTVGNGIGHDIAAVLDANTNQTIILNDYYESDLDSYQNGKIAYDFSSLSIGQHNLKLKVWDVNNNSSETYTEFIVANSSELVLDHIFNYPNPFTTNTNFYFDHNQPNTDLDVMIQIFTVTGKLIKTIEAKVFSSGYHSAPINWNGLDDFGDRIGRGVYIYRIKVRPPTGKIIDKFEKLVILK
ncbi:MAG: type IX secretion system sortase PorU [Bacteroidia bacterium]|nr:type IX secretion system sortase PorU [Bacteroidia bacterium]